MPQYFMANFMFSNDIIIHPDIQNREIYPFTMEKAGVFFNVFASELFSFEGKIGSMVIYDGKENSPRHSYANGWLYKETADELEKMPELPKSIGTIDFEYGGTLSTPKIIAKKLLS